MFFLQHGFVIFTFCTAWSAKAHVMPMQQQYVWSRNKPVVNVIYLLFLILLAVHFVASLLRKKEKWLCVVRKRSLQAHDASRWWSVSSTSHYAHCVLTVVLDPCENLTAVYRHGFCCANTCLPSCLTCDVTFYAWYLSCDSSSQAGQCFSTS